ncbi:hypothetical protein [Catenuloplanes japonicus]|uniref:hypothetical protein n=1 Tax=Catenuloplanes japonicus TaxID=33876 RepID=UPI000525E1D3|nr:hypothetical protein [Catenuloplanes japonicus]
MNARVSAGAALDVYDIEPLPAGHHLRTGLRSGPVWCASGTLPPEPSWSRAWYKIMMRTLRCHRRVALPASPEGEELVALNATVHGELVAVSAPSARLREPRARVHLHSAADGWREIPLDGVTIAPSRVDLLPGAELLLAQSRCITPPFQAPRENAQVFDDAGRPLRAFRLGDGIGHLLVDAPGTIWAGYIDEGIYSGDPLSAGGITRFDEYGRRLWSHWPSSGLADMADCYALNVGDRTVWTCYFPYYPLVRITDTRVRAYRPAPISRIRAVLVQDDVVVYVSGHGKQSQLTECRLRGDAVVPHGPVPLTDPAGRPVEDFRVISARGSRLFIRTAGHILEADLAAHDDLMVR